MSQLNISLLILFLFLSTFVESDTFDQKSLALTIYNNGFAMIKDTRTFNFKKGSSMLYFTDVSSTIQPQTVTFKPLIQSNQKINISVSQQNYQHNLITKESLYKKYLNKYIQVQFLKDKHSTSIIKGILLNNEYDNFIIQKKDTKQIVSINNVLLIILKQIPQDFYTKPTLNWKVFSNQQISTDCQVAYRATGFSWKSDYILSLNQNQTKADITGWVTIHNQGSKRYQNSTLKLIAGQVNTISDGNNTDYVQEQQDQSQLMGGYPPQFSQKSFSDFHLYTLSQNVDLNPQSSKQIQFIPPIYSVNIDRYYEIDVNAGGRDQQNLQVKSYIKFQNSKKNHPKLGIPFPKGIIRVFKNDQSDNSLQFIGQDSIDHTPKNEKIKIAIGNAFDIVAKVQAISKRNFENSGFQAHMNMTISNHGQNQKKVQVDINSYYGGSMDIKLQNDMTELTKYSNQLYKFTFKIKKDETLNFKWVQNFSGY